MIKKCLNCTAMYQIDVSTPEALSYCLECGGCLIVEGSNVNAMSAASSLLGAAAAASPLREEVCRAFHARSSGSSAQRCPGCGRTDQEQHENVLPYPAASYVENHFAPASAASAASSSPAPLLDQHLIPRSTVAGPASFNKLAPDVFEHHLLPYLAPTELSALTRVNKAMHQMIHVLQLSLKQLQAFALKKGFDRELVNSLSPEMLRAIYHQARYSGLIAAGGGHSLVVVEGGVYATGRNEYGRLGFGDNTDRNHFFRVPLVLSTGVHIVAVSAGLDHSIALASNGQVYATGRNEDGQLGFGDNTNRKHFFPVPLVLSTGVHIVAVSAGSYYSIALASNGQVYATGSNRRGQLGLGDIVNRNTFTLVPMQAEVKVVAISAGRSHALILTSSGSVYATGSNSSGGLGLEDADTRNRFTPITSLAGIHIVAIAAGNSHSFALDSNGRLYAAGENSYGQLGLGHNVSINKFTLVRFLPSDDICIVGIAAGMFHSFALDSNGRLYATGWNSHNQLGLGDTKNRKEFTLVSRLLGAHIIAVVASSCFYVCFALDLDRKLYATGENFSGQLGLGDTKNRNKFTLVPLPSLFSSFTPQSPAKCSHPNKRLLHKGGLFEADHYYCFSCESALKIYLGIVVG